MTSVRYSAPRCPLASPSVETNAYTQLKGIERRELDRLTTYLRGLEPAGWTEQSYCSDWAVYQVVSHIGSGSQIGGLRVSAWTANGAPVTANAISLTSS